jgi:membrane protease YdiL (CAAX protease family)
MNTTLFLTNIGGKFGTMLIAATITYALSRLFKMRPASISLENPRRRAGVALRSLAIVYVLATAFLLGHHSCTTYPKGASPSSTSGVATVPPGGDSTVDSFIANQELVDRTAQPSSGAQQPETQEGLTTGPEDAFGQLFLLLIFYTPFFIALRREKETLSSAGINRQFLTGSIVIGLTIGVIWTLTTLAGKSFQTDWRVAHFWSFLQYVVVGFFEEFAFRGYLQTRLINWLGKTTGWLLVAVLFSLIHFGDRMVMLGMEPGEALLDCLTLIPISLFFGFVMLRTGSIVAPGIIHTFANWIETL